MATVLQFPPMAKINIDTLPNRVREWRQQRGLTLRDLAKAVGLAHGSVQRIETGERELNQFWMEKMGEVLKVTPADFLLPHMGGLSVEERAMIDTFRQVPEANRRLILGVIDSQQAFRGGPETHEFETRKTA